MIEVEERIPQAAVWLATEQGGQKIATGDYFAGRKILLFGLPGAFTPMFNCVCSMPCRSPSPRRKCSDSR